MEIHEFQMRARLDGEALQAWIEARWLVPKRVEGRPHFGEIDLARAQLIADLTRDLGVNEEGVPIILDLVDQIHALRRSLGTVIAALGTAPEDLRRRIAAAIAEAEAAKTATGGAGPGRQGQG
jgi:chaperone modulatory protein CbpM